MATTQLNISGGTSPYSISVKKYGDNTERFVSYIGTTLTFNADASLNTSFTYIIDITDANNCEVVSSTFLHCPYDCGTLPIISDVSVECEELSAELTFTYTSDTPVQVGLGNDFHGDWYWQTHPSGTHTITNSVPKFLSTVIQVYKQNTELSCKTIQVVNPDCEETCVFSFTTNNPACVSDSVANVLISATTSYWTPTVYESSQMSTNRFVSRVGNLVQFTPISDGLPHTYIINIKQLDEEGIETGCEYSRSITLTCGTEGIQCPILDIVFCLDDSSSVRALGGEDLLKNGVKSIVEILSPNINNGNVKIGITKFSDFSDKLLDLSFNITQINSAIDSLTFQGFTTNMCSGLSMANNTLRNSSYARDCNKILVLVTDGEPNRTCSGMQETEGVIKAGTLIVATNAKALPYVGTSGNFNIKIMCIGITSSADGAFLQTLSSTPSDTTIVSTFPEFAAISQDIAEDLCT